MPKKTISVSELRANPTKVLKFVNKPGQPITITQRGKPEAVIMNIKEYEGWLETMDIMADKELMKKLKKAEEGVNKKRLYSHKEVFKKRPDKKDSLYSVIGIANIKDNILNR